MRLLVDASAAFNQAAGIGRYARNVLAHGLRELAGQPDFALTLFYGPERPGPPPYEREVRAAVPPGVPVVVRRAPLSRKRLDQLWHRAGLGLGAAFLAGDADLIYCPDFLAPPVAGVPKVVTVHDLAFVVCPERAPAGLVGFLRAAVTRQVRAAAAVAVVSEASRRDLVERLGVAPERVAVVPNGVDARFFAARPPDDEQRRRLGLPAAYLLMVGTLEPRKNHLGAFAALRTGSVPDLPLLVAGRRGWQDEPIRRAAADLVAGGRVLFLDFVPEADLPALYAGAAALVYPSWYEGFGLPVVEALAAGTPVVISAAPALVEVGGDVVEVAEAGDPADLAAAIGRALASAAGGEVARQRRRVRARRYSWAASGVALARLLRAHGG
jgi:glycosyltransferase involved in cell wall biosynthesis